MKTFPSHARVVIIGGGVVCCSILWRVRRLRHVRSGGYAHVVGQSMAIGYVPAAFNEPGNPFEVELLGDGVAAELVSEPLYDPSGAKMCG